MQINLYNEHGEWLGLTATMSSTKSLEDMLEKSIRLGKRILSNEDGEGEDWEDAASFDITDEYNEVLYPV